MFNHRGYLALGKMLLEDLSPRGAYTTSRKSYRTLEVNNYRNYYILTKEVACFFFFEILPQILKNHAADPNGSVDPRLGSPGLQRVKPQRPFNA